MSENSAFKANLKVCLYADKILVAESEDPILWQRILTSLAQKQTATFAPEEKTKASGPIPPSKINEGINNVTDAIDKFAQELNITREEVIGACQPQMEAPYLTLNKKNWEKFVDNTPTRGPNAISRIGLAGALLCLWFDSAGIEGEPSATDCQNVLKTIALVENNPSRSFSNSPWLMKRGKGFHINPSQTSRAIEIAKAYCTALKMAKAA